MSNFERKKLPIIGWSSWNAFGGAIDEEKLIAQMDAIVEKGLLDAGYEYLNIDDCWQDGRDEVTGRIKYNKEKFPHGMKYIADEAHKRGLKAGIYSDAGDNTCASESGKRPYGRNVGLWKHEEDLWTYLSDGNYRDEYARNTPDDPGVECWGYDFIKVDWCGGRDNRLSFEERYTAYNDIINEIEEKNQKDKIFNICCWGYAGDWILKTGDSWRCGGDIDMSGTNFPSVIGAIDVMKRVGHLNRPGHFVDPDMLVVGKKLTLAEDRTHFAMWCMFSTPLVLGCDLTQVSDETIELITNPELIAIHQDPACVSAWYRGRNWGVETWLKPLGALESNTYAIAFFNDTDEEKSIHFDSYCYGLDDRFYIRDVINHKDVSEGTNYVFELKPHDTMVLKLTPTGSIISIDEDECISGEEARRLVKEELAVLLDVRSAEEYENEHIDGAVNLEYTKIYRDAAAFIPDKERAVVVYCSTARRSAQAEIALKWLGYKKVYNLGSITNY